jgi:NADH-quinone oxidoreductase subunit M
MIPDPNLIATYFKAAELPQSLFAVLVVLLISSIFAHWLFSFHRQKGDEKKVWFNWLKIKLYLLFINRLYLDALGQRLYEATRRFVRRLNDSLLYFGIALYGIPLWHFVEEGQVTPQILVYAWSATLVLTGLFFALNRLRARYGKFDLKHLRGLFLSMPSFTICFTLLVMAAIGLPPFGLFFAYLGILFSPNVSISFVVTVLLLLFAWSCYLLSFTQELLSGTSSNDLYHKDLNIFEIIVFVVILVLLIIPGFVQEIWLMEVIQ